MFYPSYSEKSSIGGGEIKLEAFIRSPFFPILNPSLSIKATCNFFIFSHATPTDAKVGVADRALQRERVIEPIELLPLSNKSLPC